MLFYGPIENQTFWQENFYRRVHPQLLEYLIDSRMPIDSDAIERAGAQVKGFATAEYLLFGPVAPPQRPGGRVTTNSVESWLLEGNTAARHRQYLCEVTRNLDQQLQAAAGQARDEKFLDDFASKGQTSVDLLVNELTVALETDLTLPLQNYVRIPNWQQRVARDQANETEGDCSGTTFSEMKMSLAGLRRFYSGGGGTGLKDYLQHVNPGLADRLEAQFQATATALDALDNSTQSKMLAQRPALQNTLEQTHKLEILLKTDLTSALGVTIMFNAYDGD
jgi:predicted lipoprotein